MLSKDEAREAFFGKEPIAPVLPNNPSNCESTFRILTSINFVGTFILWSFAYFSSCDRISDPQLVCIRPFLFWTGIGTLITGIICFYLWLKTGAKLATYPARYKKYLEDRNVFLDLIHEYWSKVSYEKKLISSSLDNGELTIVVPLAPERSETHRYNIPI